MSLVSYFENTNNREFFLHVSCFSEGDVSAEEKNAEHFLDKVRFSTSSRKHLFSPYLTENNHTSPGAEVQCECSGTRRATIPAAARTSAGAAGA